MADADVRARHFLSGVVEAPGGRMESRIIHTTLTIKKSRTGFDITFTYDPAVVEMMRDIGGEWDKVKKVWKVPRDIHALQPILESECVIECSDDLNLEFDDMFKVSQRLAAARSASDATLSYELADKLYAYQRVAVGFLAEAGSGMLTDMMGLGKTVEMVATIRELELLGKIERQRYLIVCPNSMRYTWKREIEKWYPEAVNIYMVGERGCPTNLDLDGIYITNWEKTWRKAELAKVKWDVAIVDEAHRMKGRQTKQSKAVRTFKADHRFALTGTPIRNEVTDLWAQLNFVEPSRWTSFWKFFNRYAEFTDGFFGREVTGVRNEEELKKRLLTTMIGRTLDEVELQLPQLVEKNVVVELGQQQRKAYDEMRDQFVAFIEGMDDDALLAPNWLTQSLRLKQLSGSLGIFSNTWDDSAKIDALFELIDEAPADEKWVVMSQFKTMVDQTTARLRKEGIGYCELTGNSCYAWLPPGHSHTAKTRDELVQWFQKSDKPRVFIATTQTGGEGLTLTAARRFVFLDLLWTPGENEQAWRRVYRMGQDRTTFIYRLLAKNTIDFSGILPKLKSKEAIIAAVMSPADDL